MKLTLLVPTDFSRAARNAVNYAVEIAKRTKAILVLQHVYAPPVIVSEFPMIIPPFAESEAYCMQKLKRLRHDLLSKPGNKKLQIELTCACGIAVDEIYLYCLKRKVDFIVMGMQGKGFVKEKLMGSTTTKLIQKSEVPVLSIDKKVKFRSIKRIVFAGDKRGEVNRSTLHPLYQLSGFFKSHVYILNVVPGKPLIQGEDELFDKNISRSFKDFDYSLHRSMNPSIQDGINQFITAKKIDMLVMVPHQHTFAERVVNGRQTKRMAFHTSVPLLMLHEKGSTKNKKTNT
jgi:nucleotide-binding universal stress UspA family protein